MPGGSSAIELQESERCEWTSKTREDDALSCSTSEGLGLTLVDKIVREMSSATASKQKALVGKLVVVERRKSERDVDGWGIFMDVQNPTWRQRLSKHRPYYGRRQDRQDVFVVRDYCPGRRVIG
ncbi:hypothetical protein GE21DRAFT_1307855 [Neurospora crassa]|nr:hypothetical protein B7J19.50 [imported] - Neurospora crassa [Neurospora crassa]KHE85239.1 hypothetical protein GE21DRAFT_1307855 [Neurospora crassa]